MKDRASARGGCWRLQASAGDRDRDLPAWPDLVPDPLRSAAAQRLHQGEHPLDLRGYLLPALTACAARPQHPERPQKPRMITGGYAANSALACGLERSQ